MSQWIPALAGMTVLLMGALGSPVLHAQTPNQKFSGIGRAATPAEIAAWDIDVRADFKGLPKGSGSVKRGQEVWEAKCESCHGVFGESNEVFTPVIGGTTKKDIETGTVANLRRADFPQRTTMMKLSQVSTLWDYINRAMPWNAPKSLSVEDVYAVTAYVLHLADVVPAEFVLSDSNIANVQSKLPNRNGKVKWEPLWNVRGRGDVTNVACMTNCKQELRVTSFLPDFARNAHGNLAEQSREIGPMRGTDTTQPAKTSDIGDTVSNAARVKVATVATSPPRPAASIAALANKYTCSACHQANKKLVGPSYGEIAKKYAGDAGAEAALMQKVKNGGSGVWGTVPMPPSPQVSEDDLRALVRWVLAGGK